MCGKNHTLSNAKSEEDYCQGLGCSPIKVARELGSERRETVRSLSIVADIILGILTEGILYEEFATKVLEGRPIRNNNCKNQLSR